LRRIAKRQLKAFKRALVQRFQDNRLLRATKTQVKPKFEITCINIDHEAFAEADRRDRRKAVLAPTPRSERVRYM
jgi:hypothetical protein